MSLWLHWRLTHCSTWHCRFNATIRLPVPVIESWRRWISLALNRIQARLWHREELTRAFANFTGTINKPIRIFDSCVPIRRIVNLANWYQGRIVCYHPADHPVHNRLYSIQSRRLCTVLHCVKLNTYRLISISLSRTPIAFVQSFDRCPGPYQPLSDGLDPYLGSGGLPAHTGHQGSVRGERYVMVVLKLFVSIFWHRISSSLGIFVGNEMNIVVEPSCFFAMSSQHYVQW